MEKLIYDQLWIFFVYSFVGWVIGTILAAYRRKKFVDVGFYMDHIAHPMVFVGFCFLFYYMNFMINGFLCS